jgi:SanA protein
MMKSKFWKIIRRSVSLIIAVFIVLAIISNVVVLSSSRRYLYSIIDELPHKYTGLVLGAKAKNDLLSQVLRDRVNAGIELKLKNIVNVLLLSGDHGKKNYDEVNNMRKYILTNTSKIEKEAIFLDHAGFDTYDSLIRARDVFECNSIIIITQKFHISRAVYIARSLGLDAVGYALPENEYRTTTRVYWQFREIFARTKAFTNVVFHSKPKFLGDKIPITGNGLSTWDQE